MDLARFERFQLPLVWGREKGKEKGESLRFGREESINGIMRRKKKRCNGKRNRGRGVA